PLWIVRHVPSVRRIQQKRNRSVRFAAIGMFFGEADKLVRDAAQRIQLKRVLAGPRLEELIESLLEIDRRSTRHVIKVVTLAVPLQRRTYRCAVTRVEEVVWAGEVLLPGKRRR